MEEKGSSWGGGVVSFSERENWLGESKKGVIKRMGKSVVHGIYNRSRWGKWELQNKEWKIRGKGRKVKWTISVSPSLPPIGEIGTV